MTTARDLDYLVSHDGAPAVRALRDAVRELAARVADQEARLARLEGRCPLS